MAATDRLLLPLLFTAMAACGGSSKDVAHSFVPATPPASRVFVYRCQTGEAITVRFLGDHANLTTTAGTVTLPQTPAASGVRYQSGGTVLWSKGREAILATPAGGQTSCIVEGDDQPWREAYNWSIDFHGTGSAPVWSIEIDEGKDIRFVTDYGARTIYTPTPKPRFQSDSAIYDASGGAYAMTVWIRSAPCRDRADGTSHPFTVTATLDRKTYQGCGRRLP